MRVFLFVHTLQTYYFARVPRRDAMVGFFLHTHQQASECNEKGSQSLVRVAVRQCDGEDTMDADHGQAQRIIALVAKIRIITIALRRALPEIKLKRTNTTLDLSQKAIYEESRLAVALLVKIFHILQVVGLTYQRELKNSNIGGRAIRVEEDIFMLGREMHGPAGSPLTAYHVRDSAGYLGIHCCHLFAMYRGTISWVKIFVRQLLRHHGFLSQEKLPVSYSQHQKGRHHHWRMSL